MGRMCYLCLRKASKLDGISLHKFPKNPIIRKKWIEVCDLSPSDNLTCVYICSMHFDAKDLDTNGWQTRCALKASAIPSVGVPNQIKCEIIRPCDIKTMKTQNVDMYGNTMLHVFENIHVNEVEVVCDKSNENLIEQCEDVIKHPCLITMDPRVDANVSQMKESSSTPAKGKMFTVDEFSSNYEPECKLMTDDLSGNEHNYFHNLGRTIEVTVEGIKVETPDVHEIQENEVENEAADNITHSNVFEEIYVKEEKVFDQASDEIPFEHCENSVECGIDDNIRQFHVNECSSSSLEESSDTHECGFTHHGERCYLCRRKKSKLDGISLHKFPKNPIVRKKWIEVCDLSPSDNLTCVYICSMHFDAKDLDTNGWQTRCALKANAIPSVGVPNQIKCENLDVTNVETVDKTLSDEVKTTDLPEDEVENDNKLDNTITHDNVFEEIFVRESEVAEYMDEIEEDSSSEPQRRVFEPRYVSEIRMTDFETPEIRKRVLNLLKLTDRKKSGIIKSLRAQNWKLEKRISLLENQIVSLQKEMKPGRTAHTLMKSKMNSGIRGRPRGSRLPPSYRTERTANRERQLILRSTSSFLARRYPVG